MNIYGFGPKEEPPRNEVLILIESFIKKEYPDKSAKDKAKLFERFMKDKRLVKILDHLLEVTSEKESRSDSVSPSSGTPEQEVRPSSSEPADPKKMVEEVIRIIKEQERNRIKDKFMKVFE